MKTKQCKKCNKFLDINLFPVRKDSADGYRNECKECKKKYMSSFYSENREEQIKKRSEYKAKRRSTDHKWRFWKNFEDRVGEFKRKRGYTVNSTTQEMVGITREDFYKYIEAQFTDKGISSYSTSDYFSDFNNERLRLTGEYAMVIQDHKDNILAEMNKVWDDHNEKVSKTQ